jgi:uncharacterized membrane protein (UPF0127 family)
MNKPCFCSPSSLTAAPFVACLVLLILLASGCSKVPPTPLPAPHPAHGIAEVSGIPYYVDIAWTKKEQEAGLMFRDILGAHNGMLFIFDKEQPMAFWMKNTHIPLDILYFNHQGHLVDMKLGAVPCQPRTNCPVYPSKAPAQYVLEINAGQSEVMKFGQGSRLKITAPAPAPQAVMEFSAQPHN